VQCYQIVNTKRVTAFIVQISHQSGQLINVRERCVDTLAQASYEGRKDLGNTEVGDGFQFTERLRSKLSVSARQSDVIGRI
jgi:putative chitinase